MGSSNLSVKHASRNNTALDFCRGRNPVIEENCSLIESAGGKLGLMLNQDLAGDAHDDDDEDMETEAAREHDSV